MWVGISTDHFVNDPVRPLWALSHIDPDCWLLAGEMETGGGALSWPKDLLAEAPGQIDDALDYEQLQALAGKAPPGALRLIFAPWLSGKRAPVFDHYARGAFIGPSLAHRPVHLARPVMEGVGYHLRWVIEHIKGMDFEVECLNTIGGGAAGSLWPQIISDIIGLPLDIVVEPQHALRPRYNALYREYRGIYQALAPVFRRLRRRPGGLAAFERLARASSCLMLFGRGAINVLMEARPPLHRPPCHNCFAAKSHAGRLRDQEWGIPRWQPNCACSRASGG
jgi:hypothetical protein